MVSSDFERCARSTSGVTYLEHAIIVSLIAILAFGAWSALGSSIGEKVDCAAAALAGAARPCSTEAASSGRLERSDIGSLPLALRTGGGGAGGGSGGGESGASVGERGGALSIDDRRETSVAGAEDPPPSADHDEYPNGTIDRERWSTDDGYVRYEVVRNTSGRAMSRTEQAYEWCHGCPGGARLIHDYEVKTPGADEVDPSLLNTINAPDALTWSTTEIEYFDWGDTHFRYIYDMSEQAGPETASLDVDRDLGRVRGLADHRVRTTTLEHLDLDGTWRAVAIYGQHVSGPGNGTMNVAYAYNEPRGSLKFVRYNDRSNAPGADEFDIAIMTVIEQDGSETTYTADLELRGRIWTIHRNGERVASGHVEQSGWWLWATEEVVVSEGHVPDEQRFEQFAEATVKATQEEMHQSLFQDVVGPIPMSGFPENFLTSGPPPPPARPTIDRFANRGR